ncbi:MAG: hypothetical protein ABIK77_01090 [candidate division WOR-3 bacterium]
MKKKIGFRVSRHQIVKSLSRQRKIIKPTKIFESKKLYKRNKQKEELKKMIKEENIEDN